MRVGSLPGSFVSYLACLVLRELGRSVFVMVAEEAEAQRVAGEMEFYAQALSVEAGVHFLPRRPLFSSLGVERPGLRTAALSAMVAASSASPTLISASLEASLVRTLPPELLSDHLLELRPGADLDRELFLGSLVRSGYTAVSAVMEPGDFSVRGGILDVFPPGATSPIRIELEADKIATLRRFDPASQKSVSSVPRAVIGPLKEVILTPAHVQQADAEVRRAAERLKGHELLSEGKVDLMRSVAEVLERINHREHFPGLESYLPAFVRERTSALSYLDHTWVVIVVEPFLAEQAFQKQLAEYEEEWRRELGRGNFFLPPTEQFIFREEAEQALAGCALIVSGVESTFSRAAVSETASGLGLPEESEEERELGAPRLPDGGGVFSPALVGDLSAFKVQAESEEPLAPFVSGLRDLREQGIKILVVSPLAGKAHHLAELLQGHELELPVREEARGALLSSEPALITVGALTRGFLDLGGRWAVIPEAEVFGEKIRPRRSPRPATDFFSDFSDLAENDYVVHVDHGIGIYRGLTSLFVQWVGEWDFVRERERPRLRMDCAQIEYAGGATLYLPVHRLNQLSRYRGPSEIPPALDTLGGTAWDRFKKKAKAEVHEFALRLLSLYASRQVHEGVAFGPVDHTFREFEETFEYEETPDQLRAIEEVLADMEQSRPMDRIVCGDVGYGKTEVALRASFLAAMSGKQVAVLTPTTLLAQQHAETFSRRLSRYPLKVRLLSRFLSPKETKQVLAEIKEGQADIVIGTHRLLSRDVHFRDLGLLIIDEEHRFGVRHKERLRELRSTVDTLTLTATPIPRTLHLALSGLRDLSIINTPPADRLAVHTEVCRHDDRLIREAIERELRRGGQVFYVHNRVQTIGLVAERVRKLMPQARVAIAHGQMPERELENVMRDFVAHRYDVLVCSAIIESGLDIPTVNTMIVDRADQFGLAQLYQLRGRIGRSNQRAYCYLLVPAKGILTAEAAKRLKALKDFAELGSGFRVAAHDLELRGAGNLLGPEQSGHMARIGMELYLRLLEEEVLKLKGEPREEEREPEIKLPVAAYLPEEYMPDQYQRLSWYQRLSRARSEGELSALEEEMRDRYGPLPEPAQQLLEVAQIKLKLRALRALELGYNGEEISLALSEDTTADVPGLLQLATKHPTQYRLSPENRFFKKLRAKNPAELFLGLRAFLAEVIGYNEKKR